MLNHLDHIVLICPDIESGIQTYETLLGRQADHVSTSEAGLASALFVLGNTALEILSPTTPESRRKFKTLLSGAKGRLTTLAFSAEDLPETRRIFGRRGLKPGEISDGQSIDKNCGETLTWDRFRCPDEVCAGIKTFVISRKEPLTPTDSEPGAAHKLDHVVIETPNPERTIAHYGARLGLRFALDRTIDAFGTRFLFFRSGGLTIEIIHRLVRDYDPASHDTFWGLTWAVDDLHAAHNRLSKKDIDISEIRPGRKPGTEVFTVRNGTLDIPTLFISNTGNQGQ